MQLDVLHDTLSAESQPSGPTATNRRPSDAVFTVDRLTSPTVPSNTERFRVLTLRDLDRIEQIRKLPKADRWAMRVIATVLPFRVNTYVIDQLIDWCAVTWPLGDWESLRAP